MTAQLTEEQTRQLDHLALAINEAYRYGAKNDSKRSLAAQKRIAKALAEATGIPVREIESHLDPIY
jgi:hypothetical protein